MIKRICERCQGTGYDIMRTEEQQALIEVWWWVCMNRINDKILFNKVKDIIERNLGINIKI